MSLDDERRSHGALRVVAVGERRAEDAHHRVADELLDDAAERLDLAAHAVVVRRQDCTNVLGIEPFGSGREPDEVDEDDGDDPPLVPGASSPRRSRRRRRGRSGRPKCSPGRRQDRRSFQEPKAASAESRAGSRRSANCLEMATGLHSMLRWPRIRSTLTRPPCHARFVATTGARPRSSSGAWRGTSPCCRESIESSSKAPKNCTRPPGSGPTSTKTPTLCSPLRKGLRASCVSRPAPNARRRSGRPRAGRLRSRRKPSAQRRMRARCWRPPPSCARA